MPNAAARLWDQLGLEGRPDAGPIRRRRSSECSRNNPLPGVSRSFPASKKADGRAVWVDTHCHLQLAEAEPRESMDRAAHAGVGWVMVPGVDAHLVGGRPAAGAKRSIASSGRPASIPTTPPSGRARPIGSPSWPPTRTPSARWGSTSIGACRRAALRSRCSGPRSRSPRPTSFPSSSIAATPSRRSTRSSRTPEPGRRPCCTAGRPVRAGPSGFVTSA